MTTGRTDDLYRLPDSLPVPADDGAAAHLLGLRLPPLPLPATDGSTVDLSRVGGRAVVFAYPRTGLPDQPPLVPEWNDIPGARGCTPQMCSYRDVAAEFRAAGVQLFGLSTQTTEYQQEAARRLGLSFPLLSDAARELTAALRLPTFEAAGLTLLKRLTWVQLDGVIRAVRYPVFPPDRDAAAALDLVRSLDDHH